MTNSQDDEKDAIDQAEERLYRASRTTLALTVVRFDAPAGEHQR